MILLAVSWPCVWELFERLSCQSGNKGGHEEEARSRANEMQARREGRMMMMRRMKRKMKRRRRRRRRIEKRNKSGGERLKKVGTG